MRRAIIISVLTAVIGLVGVGIGLERRTNKEAQPLPPPPTPGAQTGTPPPLPGQGKPDYLVVPKELAGMVVHIVGTVSFRDRGSPDPSNGRPLSIEAWPKFDSDGAPEQYHMLSSYADGSFHQEILATAYEMTMVREPASATRFPDGTRSCADRTPSIPAYLQAVVPQFIDAAALARAGFRDRGNAPASTPLPMPQIVSGRIPSKIHPSEITPRHWLQESPGGGLAGSSRTTNTFEAGLDGRVQVSEFREADARGASISEKYAAWGPLEVFAPSQVPETAFSVSRGGCNG